MNGQCNASEQDSFVLFTELIFKTEAHVSDLQRNGIDCLSQQKSLVFLAEDFGA